MDRDDLKNTFDILINLLNKNNQTSQIALSLLKHVTGKVESNDKDFKRVKDALACDIFKGKFELYRQVLASDDFDNIKAIILKLGLEDVDDVGDSAKPIKQATSDARSGGGSIIDAYSTTNMTKQTKLEISSLSSTMRKFHTQASPINKYTTSTGILNDLKNEGVKSQNRDMKFPFARIGADITLTLNQINKAFIKEAKAQGFIVKGNENDEYIQIEKRHFELFQSLLDCFRSGEENRVNQTKTCISISSRISDINKFERIIDMVGHAGKKDLISLQINGTFKRLRTYGKKLRSIRLQDVDAKLLFKQDKPSSSEKLPFVSSMNLGSFGTIQEEEPNLIEKMNGYTSTFYEINKILTQEKYELGRSIKDFVSNFNSKNNDIHVSYLVLPNQMEEVIRFIEDCAQSFSCYYNMGEKGVPCNRANVSKLAVERYIFTKCYPILIDLYNQKFENEGKIFKTHQEIIKQKYDYSGIMEYLEVSNKTNLIIR